MIEHIKNDWDTTSQVISLTEKVNQLVDFANSLQGEKCAVESCDGNNKLHSEYHNKTPSQIDVGALLEEYKHLVWRESSSALDDVENNRMNQIVETIKQLTHKA